MDGASIGGLTDYTPGQAADADSVSYYIKLHMPVWLAEEQFAGQVKSCF